MSNVDEDLIRTELQIATDFSNCRQLHEFEDFVDDDADDFNDFEEELELELEIAQKYEESDLRKLLKSWNFEYLYDHMNGNFLKAKC